MVVITFIYAARTRNLEDLRGNVKGFKFLEKLCLAPKGVSMSVKRALGQRKYDRIVTPAKPCTSRFLFMNVATEPDHIPVYWPRSCMREGGGVQVRWTGQGFCECFLSFMRVKPCTCPCFHECSRRRRSYSSVLASPRNYNSWIPEGGGVQVR